MCMSISHIEIVNLGYSTPRVGSSYRYLKGMFQGDWPAASGEKQRRRGGKRNSPHRLQILNTATMKLEKLTIDIKSSHHYSSSSSSSCLLPEPELTHKASTNQNRLEVVTAIHEDEDRIFLYLWGAVATARWRPLVEILRQALVKPPSARWRESSTRSKTTTWPLQNPKLDECGNPLKLGWINFVWMNFSRRRL